MEEESKIDINKIRIVDKNIFPFDINEHNYL